MAQNLPFDIWALTYGPKSTDFLQKYFRDVSREFDEFRVNAHILQAALLVLVIFLSSSETKSRENGPLVGRFQRDVAGAYPAPPASPGCWLGLGGRRDQDRVRIQSKINGRKHRNELQILGHAKFPCRSQTIRRLFLAPIRLWAYTSSRCFLLLISMFERDDISCPGVCVGGGGEF